MERTIKLTELEERLADLPYPVGQELAAALLNDTTLALADGEVNLGEVIETADVDRFESAGEADSVVRSCLPRRAVGEPYQSEGEG